MGFTALQSLDLSKKRVLLRCDLNVPIKEGVIRDDGRIRASLPTINYLIEALSSPLISVVQKVSAIQI
jgi:phosphoglycerate kinase